MKKILTILVIFMTLSLGACNLDLESMIPSIPGDDEIKDKNDKENLEMEKIYSVMPGAMGFEEITDTLTISPESGVSAVYKEEAGKGYVFIASKSNSPMKDVVTVTVGVAMDGKITGVHAEFANSADFKVGQNTLDSFVGSDSTLGDVVITSGATVSTNAIKEAVTAGFTVLASNVLTKPVGKTTEQVFEELLPTVFNGFVRGSDLTVSGNIIVAYKAVNKSGLVCYVTSDEQTLLAVVNVSGIVNVYKAKCLDENTQQYELVDITSESADVVSEVSTFAASHLSTSFATLETKVNSLFDGEAIVTELSVKNTGVVTAAATAVVGEATYYAYLAQPTHGFEGDIMSVYVVLDSEGKIYYTSAKQYFFGATMYYPPLNNFNGAAFYAGLVGANESSYNVGDFTIAGATFTTQAMDLAIKAVFDEFNTK